MEHSDTMEETLAELRKRLGEIADVQSAASLLSWDQETYMPKKAGPGRGEQLATLAGIAHRFFVSPELGALLDDLDAARDAISPADAKLVEVVRYEYARSMKLPEAFVQRFAQEQSRALEAWVRAREASDFQAFQPHFETLVDLSKEKAGYLGYEGSPYNALLDEFERGMTAEQLKVLFGELASQQSALVARIMESPNQPDTSWLTGEWDEQPQWDFTLRVLGDMGFDLEAGRQDKSVHPFTANFDVYDVRLTTRLSRTDLFSALMGSIHEGGHGLYIQGHDPADRRTPLLEGASLGMHESQSRMWENVIGRSLPFWCHYVPLLRDAFPGRLDGVTPEQVHRTVNRVQPSLIRVEADECTYNLHIILRFEIEVALMEGDISVAQVPEAWNAKMKEYLGLDVPDDTHGCLQDIHWSHGAIGYFPTYALGNLYAAQIGETMEKEMPGLWEDVAIGQFGELLAWLRENIHRHGRRKLAGEIVRDITGEDPSPAPYLRYLESKFSKLYAL
jgi:carboxypeptidase Taq